MTWSEAEADKIKDVYNTFDTRQRHLKALNYIWGASASFGGSEQERAAWSATCASAAIHPESFRSMERQKNKMSYEDNEKMIMLEEKGLLIQISSYEFTWLEPVEVLVTDLDDLLMKGGAIQNCAITEGSRIAVNTTVESLKSRNGIYVRKGGEFIRSEDMNSTQNTNFYAYAFYVMSGTYGLDVYVQKNKIETLNVDPVEFVRGDDFPKCLINRTV